MGSAGLKVELEDERVLQLAIAGVQVNGDCLFDSLIFEKGEGNQLICEDGDWNFAALENP